MTEHGPAVPGTQATYVFAVCRDVDPAAVRDLPGVDAVEPVRALPLGTLTAVVQSVPAADFTDEAWQSRLSDQHELERYARAHHEVVSAAAAGSPTVPLPLATLYHGDERARQALAEQADRFDSALRRTARHAEWGVKVYAPAEPSVDPVPVAPPPVARSGRTRPAAGAGLAYLERKRGMHRRRESRHDDALRTAEAVDAEVSRLATAFRRLRPHGAQQTGQRDVQVLNATYLVADHRAAELVQLTRTLQERTGTRIELSGPWVPYSFVGEV
ncbi:GvpL/GvpF family gas vesicle protein [Streptomyces chartreusis]|uniref:GvpL/GvpF family gas vesicle protein n=1 Tax=Streptomyces chartreusis TaxID=1969 RepID=A0A7H8TKH5_STRCX|nr:GvpL/GvpF family gas vesicle protein [Streptomyces chartreusis]QKZ24021.1 GvpL/GvpF family gas vesicle protein [Streptomyces chartreusis]